MQRNLADIARLEEARLADAIQRIGDESRPFAGGIAARSTPGSWCNYAVGFGFDAPLTRAEVEDIIHWYEEKGIEPRLEAHPFQHAETLALLEELKFVTRHFEFVYYRAFDAHTHAAPVVSTPPELSVRVVDKTNAVAMRQYVTIAMSGFYPEGTSPAEDDVRLALKGASGPNSVGVVAWMGDTPIGAGGSAVTGDVAALFGASVLPQYRRQGVQQALLAARLNLAANAGAKIATISSLPGAITERNVRRMGFQVAYVKSMLVRPGEGLARIHI